MMKKILFLLLCLCTAAIQADVYNVKDYGAKADGKTIDSPAINRAIQEAAANGGGTVYLPAGNYACYSIRLASHVHLLMEQGTVITAAFPTATEGYDEADGQRTPPEQEKVYPEPWMFGTIPAKGFYIRHARNIRLDNVHFHYEQPDGRPLMVTDDAIGIAYRNITSDGEVYEP